MRRRDRGFASSAKLWLVRAVSFAIAWTIVLLALGICGELLCIEAVVPIVTTWICVGILARVARSPSEVVESLPQEIDPGRALRFLVVSCLWPIYVLGNRR